LNRATLARQMLLHRQSLDVVDAVRRLVALQAQQPASPYLALWNRLSGFDPADVDEAFVDHRVVKASLIRLTLHVVHADDYPDFHNAMVTSLRASVLYDDRFKSTGLSIPDADAVLPQLTEFAAEPRLSAEIEEMLEARLGERIPRLWWALRRFAPLHHAPTGGPWSFGERASYVTAITKVESRDQSVERLVLRYLQAFGPASIQDFAQFTILRRPVVSEAMRALGDDVEEMEGPDGARLFDVAGAPLPAENTPAPARLLPMWDNVLLAYFDRSRVVPPDYRRLVIKRNGDILPTLLVDGYIAGVWRPVDGGIEATAFHRLDDEAWEGLTAEAGALVDLLADRDPNVYSRYAHWWTKGFPSAEVRLLPG
jgi:hypothetical protein